MKKLLLLVAVSVFTAGVTFILMTVSERPFDEPLNWEIYDGSPLNNKIYRFNMEKSWWYEKLCKNGKKIRFRNDTSDVIHLLTLNKDIKVHKNHTKNIFFIENNCKIEISPYVLCSLESSAAQNPDKTTYLLTLVPFLEDKSKVIRNLLKSFPNIIILQVDLDDVLKSTPLEVFRSKEIWTKYHEYIKSHISDAMRVAVIWKEGGTYLDSDTISVHKLSSHTSALVTGKYNLEACFLAFPRHHEFLSTVMNYMERSYDGNDWTTIGPKAITAGAKLYCNATVFESGKCKDITILDRKAFYFIWWENAKELLLSPNSKVDLKKFLEPGIIGLHLSHYLLGDNLNRPEGNSLYQKLTKKFCPVSFGHQS